MDLLVQLQQRPCHVGMRCQPGIFELFIGITTGTVKRYIRMVRQLHVMQDVTSEVCEASAIILTMQCE